MGRIDGVYVPRHVRLDFNDCSSNWSQRHPGHAPRNCRRCGRPWSTLRTVETPEMAKTNLTLQLDEDVIRRARVVAAKRGTSVSALVAADLASLVEQDARYAEAQERAAELMQVAVRRGGRSWRRDELHDRQ